MGGRVGGGGGGGVGVHTLYADAADMVLASCMQSTPQGEACVLVGEAWRCNAVCLSPGRG